MLLSSDCSYKLPVYFKSKFYIVLIDFWTYKKSTLAPGYALFLKDEHLTETSKISDTFFDLLPPDPNNTTTNFILIFGMLAGWLCSTYQCRATPSLSHPITGWTLTRLTGAGQSSFCSLAVTVSHVAREHWLEVFWILLIGSRYRSAHWDLWNGTIATLPWFKRVLMKLNCLCPRQIYMI